MAKNGYFRKVDFLASDADRNWLPPSHDVETIDGINCYGLRIPTKWANWNENHDARVHDPLHYVISKI